MPNLQAMPVTMSSREIADLVGSRHDKVKQSIDRLVERGVIVQPPMGDEQELDSLGRVRIIQVYNVCKRDSYIIVAQLCPEFTARLVDRWQELEEKAAIPQHHGSLTADHASIALAFTDRILAALPNLGESAKQCLLSKASEIAFGQPLIPLPTVTEHLMTATEVGEQLGISANKVGRLANLHGLKTSEYGEVRLDKSRHSSKQVESFVYRPAAVNQLRGILSSPA